MTSLTPSETTTTPTAMTKEQMRAAAYEIIKHQFENQEGKDDPVIGIANKCNEYIDAHGISHTKKEKLKNKAYSNNNNDDCYLVDLELDQSNTEDCTESHEFDPVIIQVSKISPIYPYGYEHWKQQKEERRKKRYGALYPPWWVICIPTTIVITVIAIPTILTIIQSLQPKRNPWDLLPAYTQDAILMDSNSSQALAWEFAINRCGEEFDGLPDWRIQQIMAMMTLYYNNFYRMGWPPLHPEDVEHECIWWWNTPWETNCNSKGQYQNLTLSNHWVQRDIPREIELLSSLRVLSLSDNQLTGTLPTQLGLLTRLRYLDLQNNTLTGEIPSQLGRLTSLSVLKLNDNDLSGSIPKELLLMLSSDSSSSSSRTTTAIDLSNNPLLLLDEDNNNTTSTITSHQSYDEANFDELD